MLSAAMLLLGLGNAGAQLSRYAAAEEYPVHRRGSAIGLVVWAGAFGAVGGPLLLAASGSLASSAGLAALSGPFALAAVVCAGALLAARSYRGSPAAGSSGGSRARTGTLLRAALAGSSLATMITGARPVMLAGLVTLAASTALAAIAIPPGCPAATGPRWKASTESCGAPRRPPA